MERVLVTKRSYIITNENETLVCVGKYPCGPRLLEFYNLGPNGGGAQIRTFRSEGAAKSFAMRHFPKTKTKVIPIVEELKIL